MMKTINDKQLKYLEDILHILNTEYEDFDELDIQDKTKVYIIKSVLQEYCKSRMYNEANSEWLNELKTIYHPVK